MPRPRGILVVLWTPPVSSPPHPSLDAGAEAWRGVIFHCRSRSNSLA